MNTFFVLTTDITCKYSNNSDFLYHENSKEFHLRYLWSSVLVSSALSVFLRGGPCEHALGVLGQGTDRHFAADCELQDDDLCCMSSSSSSRMDLCSANVTPLANTLSAPDTRVSVPCSGAAGELSSSLSAEAMVFRLSERGVVADGGAASVDGLSLVHPAAGASFVRHILSKGNSVDVWQGFLSFVGKFIRFRSNHPDINVPIRWPF